jgi:hypothetical protein
MFRTTRNQRKGLHEKGTLIVGFRADRRKRISNLGRNVQRIFRSFDRVEERPIPSHQRTLTQAPDKTAVAHFNVVPRQLPRETALALFHEKPPYENIIAQTMNLKVHTTTNTPCQQHIQKIASSDSWMRPNKSMSPSTLASKRSRDLGAGPLSTSPSMENVEA